MTAARQLEHRLDGRTLAKRYAVRSTLARGPGTHTVLTDDLADDRQVVLTVAAAAGAPKALAPRLAAETQSLRDLSCPQLAALKRAGTSEGLVFSVRPYVRGETLAARLRAGALSVPDGVTVARDVALGLQALHERGHVHGAVEPGNVIVADGRDPAAVVAYDGFRIGPCGDADRDLRALGVILFECLCGRRPFDCSPSDPVAAELPDMRCLRPGIPRALQAIVERLLGDERDDRYESAAAVAADLLGVLDALRRGGHVRREASPRPVREQPLKEPAYIDAGKQLGRLEAGLAAARGGRGSLVVVAAESGGGKTRLLSELADRSARSGAWTLRGQGRDQAAHSPYQVIEGVVRAVIARAAADRGFEKRLQSHLGPEAAALVEALPQLSEVLGAGISDRTALEAHGQRRSTRALTALLATLGTSQRPALMLLDDCQWADELTIELLRRWRDHAAAHPGDCNVLVIAAFRSHAVGVGERLRGLAAADRIELPVLGVGEIERLVESMAGPLPPDVVELVEHLSGGSPFMAAEALRGLVDAGALVGTAGRWRVDPERLEHEASSRRAGWNVGRRLDRLPGGVIDLLTAGAILGKQFAVEPARELAGQSLADAVSALAEGWRRRIVRYDDAGEWEFAHDKLRESLLGRLSEDRRRQLHRAAAVALEGTAADRTFELAYHFDAGGEPARALPYALSAAAGARRRYSLEIADLYYRIAQRGIEGADLATRRTIFEGLGDVAMLRGSYADAGEHLSVARTYCTDGASVAAIEGKLGSLALKQGDVRGAVSLLSDAIRALGARVPRSSGAFVLGVVWQAVRQIAHCLAPGLLVGRRRLAGAERDLLAVRLYSELAHAAWFASGKVPCTWAHLRSVNLAERYPPTAELAQTYSDHAPAMTMLPWFRRGIAYADRSLAIRQELGDVWGEGQSLHFKGVVLYGASRYAEALECCTQAVEILERTGDQWEVSTAKWHIAFCQYRLGRLSDAAKTSQDVHRAAVALGDAQAAGISLGAWGKATAGRVPGALIDVAVANLSGDVHTSAEVLQAQALRLIADDDPHGAVLALEHADQLVRRAGLRQEYVASVLPWLVTALRLELESTPPIARKQRRGLARRARRAACRARRISRSYRNNLPHVLREQGLLAAAAGQRRRARRLLEEGLRVAAAQGATHEYAVTRAVRGELDLTLDQPAGFGGLRRLQRRR